MITLGMDSHAVCAALQRHKSRIRDLVRRDLDGCAATEEIVHAPFFVHQPLRRARAPTPQPTRRSTTAPPRPGDSLQLRASAAPVFQKVKIQISPRYEALRW